MTQRDYAMLNLAVISAAIVATKWYQFPKRRRLHNQAKMIAAAWNIKY